MLTPWKEMLSRALERGYAIGAFNTYNLEITRAILSAARAKSAPVIVQTGSGALEYSGLAPLAASVLASARASTGLTAVHLDHSTRMEQVTECIRLGYTGVMIDGSALPFGENVDQTRQVVQFARAYAVSVEAELGPVLGSEDRAATQETGTTMTDPAQADEFVRATRIDALAIAIGNSHGFYRGEPNLDFARLREIRARVNVPLVLHGASGLPPETIRQAIALGVCKFNVNTEIRVAFLHALRAQLASPLTAYEIPALFAPAVAAMQRVIQEKIELFGCAGRNSSRKAAGPPL